MPPLLSPKVKRVAQLLAEQQVIEDARLEQAGKDDRWASIVFVETKVRCTATELVPQSAHSNAGAAIVAAASWQ